VLDGGKVEVIVTNTSRTTVRVPKWQLPTAFADSKVFRVTRDGMPVEFEGRMIKRAVPTASEFAVIRPGRAIRTVVDLPQAYDFRKAGTYTITYAAPLQWASLTGRVHLKERTGAPMVAQSAPVQVFIDANKASGSRPPRPVLPANPTLSDVLGVNYSGCTANQQSLLNQAVLSARAYSENAKGYLNGNTQGPRYTSWFGAYTSTRYSTAQQNFTKIDTAMDQTGGQITVNCACSENYFAYVYPTQPYQIWVCNAFWAAPLIGTDSKAGTLIHEISHFDIVANTEDYAYGQTAARNLATSNPTNALGNADNHEYFAENTPFQN
jgi:peptidyl-Lys metalloendopeptidase